MKLCIGCKFHVKSLMDPKGGLLDICVNKLGRVQNVSTVNGEPIPFNTITCNTARLPTKNIVNSGYGACGLEGKYWEQKPKNKPLNFVKSLFNWTQV